MASKRPERWKKEKGLPQSSQSGRRGNGELGLGGVTWVDMGGQEDLGAGEVAGRGAADDEAAVGAGLEPP